MSADQKRQKTVISQTRFLIIDSEPTVGEALRRFLVSEGSPAVHVAASSLIALRVLQDRKTPVDCVICAHRPAVGGLEFLTGLRSGRWGATFQYLSFILLMDAPDAAVMAAADAAKVTGYISGGLGKDNIRRSIIKALDPRGLVQALPNYKVAHTRASEADLIIAPFPASFGRLGVARQQEAIQAVTAAARLYQLGGTVIAIYPGEKGKAEFVAPAAYDRFLSKLTLAAVAKMLNRAIHVQWGDGDPTAEAQAGESDGPAVDEPVEPLPLFEEDVSEKAAGEEEGASDRRQSAPVDRAPARGLTDDDIRNVAKAFKDMGPQDFIDKFVRQQTILLRDDAQPFAPSMQEFFVSIDLLRKQFFPGVEMRGSKRAFQSLTHMLDQLMLRSLPFLPRNGLPSSLNLNVHSILTQTFDSVVKKNVSLEHLTFEIPQPMITQYFEEFKKARDLIYSRGGKIAVDQIFPDTMGALDLGLVAPNIAKVHWKGDLKNFSATHRDFVKSALDRGITMVMSRVDEPVALEIAQEFGIRNFQGFLIDEMPEAKWHA